MILPLPESELGLKEQISPRQHAVLDRGRNGSTSGGLVVMTALVGGIDAPEALAQSEPGKALRLLLLPGCPVEEARQTNAVDD